MDIKNNQSFSKSLRLIFREGFTRNSMFAISIAYWIGLFAAVLGGLLNNEPSNIVFYISIIYLAHGSIWILYRAHLKRIGEPFPNGIKETIKTAPWWSYNNPNFRKISRLGILISAIFWVSIVFILPENF